MASVSDPASSSILPPLPPRWDQSSLLGRFRHFASVTNPLLCLRTSQDVENARSLLLGASGPADEEVWRARRLCASALHPDSGHLQTLPGRMCFQVPGGMTLIAAMSAFQGSTGAVLFWQWANQSFNALVNYTNRSGGEGGGAGGALLAYCCATGCALAVSVALRRRLAGPAAQTNRLRQRLVPLAAVLAANCVNIPLMRGEELARGVCVRAEGSEEVEVKSRLAAAKGISQVVLSRCFIVTPGMLALPWLQQQRWFPAGARGSAVIVQTLVAGLILLVTVPLGCALFPQQCAIRVETLRQFEPSAYKAVQHAYSGSSPPELLYFNKGL